MPDVVVATSLALGEVSDALESIVRRLVESHCGMTPTTPRLTHGIAVTPLATHPTRRSVADRCAR